MFVKYVKNYVYGISKSLLQFIHGVLIFTHLLFCNVFRHIDNKPPIDKSIELIKIPKLL